MFYWQEIHKGEVDFVVLDGKNILPYQVTWDEPTPRHTTALDNFYAAFPQAEEAVFITQENAAEFLAN